MIVHGDENMYPQFESINNMAGISSWLTSRQEGKEARFIHPGTIYFSQKYTVLAKINWSVKSTFQIYGAPQN